jgi:triosephosphate isomerase
LKEKNMRVPLIAGNWKMNTTLPEAIRLVKDMLSELDNVSGIDKVVCPPFISLASIRNLIQGSTVKSGAQNLYFEEKGAYTGEISPVMLAGICEYAIIGHSERRQYFKETGELISKKVLAAIKHNLKPILCVGENLSDYEEGKTRDVVTEQIASSLAGINNASTLIIAYEPVWAIGTGKAATGRDANQTIGLIRKLISERYDGAIAGNMRILYGGSVTAANIAEFASQPDIDGGLVGGASLNPAEFVSIVKKTAEIRKNS